MVASSSPASPDRCLPVRSPAALVLSLLFSALLNSCSPLAPAGALVTVERVIDGDTVVLEGGARVRLLGLDAPELARDGGESECYGPEAKVFLETLIASAGRAVRLERETVRHDRYGRILAYLWDADRLLNEIVLREGYARFHAGDAVRWRERLRAAETEARAGQRGRWHPEACP